MNLRIRPARIRAAPEEEAGGLPRYNGAVFPRATAALIATAFAAAGSCAVTEPISNLPPPPPVARREPSVERLHGVERVDEYRWLRRKDAPDVLEYLRAENEYAEQVMGPTAELRETLYREMLGRIQETDSTAPAPRRGWLYYSRTVQGLQYPIHCRRRAPDGPEEILLDLNELGKLHKYVGLGVMEVSDDGARLAYGLDTTGFRQYKLHVKDLRSGALFPERIERVTSAAFSKDGATILYTVEDPVSKRSHRLYRHRVGADGAADALVYEEVDERFSVWVSRSRSGEFLFVTSASKTSSEARYVPAGEPDAEPRVVAPRETDHEYYVDHRGDRFLIRTNSGGRNFRLCDAPIGASTRADWRELVPHRDDTMLLRADPFEGFVALFERRDGLPRLRILEDAGGSREIETPESVYAMAPERNYEYGAAAFRYSYESPVTPPSVYDYDVRTGRSTLIKRTEVPGGFDPSRYAVAREFAEATDGTKVPVTIVSKRGAGPGTPRPLLLYGYGSYGASIPVGFSSNRVSLLDRGVVFAMAHIRGGGDLGKRWHDEGRMARKMNTFTDFIACADHLVERRWTSPDRLAIMGGSAGGLLVGAVLNLRPDLCAAAVLLVPFVDVINTMLDESLPLTVGEFEEWGNPKVKEHYDAMVQYSPYDNLRAAAYPAILVRTSYNDSQVMYWEPAKYVARLRARKVDSNPLVFRINLEPAGHGGASGRYEQLRETAYDYAFLLWRLGVTPILPRTPSTRPTGN
jgi:oligopeptidase B